MRKRVLITGGCGFVGRVLVRSLYETHDVCVIDNLASGINRFREAEYKKFRLLKIDICDDKTVFEAVTEFKPEILVHLAAIHYIPLCESEPASAVRTNVVGTTNLLNACPPSCRFVFASSGAVYSPSNLPHDEHSSEVGPRDVYGYTKLHGEHLVRYFCESRGISGVNVRLFNVVGPGETNPHLLPEVVAQMKSGSTTIKLGNLFPKRDYIHVKDAAAGFAAVAMKGDVVPGEAVTVNLGTSNQYSVEEIISVLKRVSSIPLHVENDPKRTRAVDRPYLHAAIAEIDRRFGWKPSFDIEHAVADLWNEPDFSSELREKYGLAF